ncbi:hypothetical protein BGZ49_000376 [Haplosporangium sp. Z 27]|nr:hypothetical protein BGZ49_000376 [Haplosporangium sp. Z 27]
MPTQLFYDFKAQLLEQMATASSPLSDSVAAVSPSIHNELQIVKSQLSNMSDLLHEVISASREHKDDIKINGRNIQVLANAVKAVDARVDCLQDTVIRLDQTNLRKLCDVSSHVNTYFTQESRQPETAQELSPDPSLILDSIVPLQEHHREPQLHQGNEVSSSSTTEDLDSLMERVAKGKRQERGQAELERQDQIPEYTMLPRNTSLQKLWDEWFHGIDGSPSIWELERCYRHHWRKADTKGEGNANAGLYMYKKQIVHSVLRAFPPGLQLQESEAAALAVK